MSKLFEVPPYSRAQVERVLKGDGRLAMQLKKENPAEYAAIRRAGEFYGIVGPEPRSASPIARMIQDTEARENAAANKSYSDEELKARAKFSPERCKELLTKSGQSGSSDTLSALKQNSPNEFRLFKLASFSYGLIPNPPAPEAAPVEPPKDSRIAISDSLADTFNLPRGTRVPSDQLSHLIELQSQINAANETAGAQK